MDYKEQIKSPKWQKRRLEILQRDDFTCQICGCKDKTLHVHHTAYEKGKMIWEYPDEMLITVCEDCHEYEHSINDSIEDELWSIRKRGVTNHEIYALLQYLDINLFQGKHDVIRNIMGDCWEIDNESPYIKKLAERRKNITDGTHKDNKT